MVSIIIPIYNIKEYMSSSVTSSVKQTFKDIEILLVDDGSNDGSGVRCDEYEKTDDRIRVIHKENGGLSSARNAGLDAARGEFIVFLDGDDYLALNAVEYLVSVQKDTDADIVQYGYIETECTYSEKNVSIGNVYEVISNKKSFYERLYSIGGEAASACTKLYKRELFKKLRFKEGILHEDEYMATRMLSEADSIAYIPEKLYFYVMRNDSIIRSDFNIKKLDFFFVSKDRIELLERLRYDDLLRLEHERYFSGLMNYYCIAAFRNSKEGCEAIINLIREYSKCGYAPLGRNKLFYALCKIDPHMVHIYYLLRKCFGHIE